MNFAYPIKLCNTRGNINFRGFFKFLLNRRPNEKIHFSEKFSGTKIIVIPYIHNWPL